MNNRGGKSLTQNTLFNIQIGLFVYVDKGKYKIL